jgi:phage shock protein PspC (stress-responsive transcriptional regulator)
MTEHATTYKELRRSRTDRMVAGVCGGLGRYFDVNPVFFRVGFVVLALLGGAGILIYGAALLVIPDDGERDSIVAEVLRDHRKRPAALVGLGLVAVAGAVLLSHARVWPHGDAAWVLVLIAGGILLWSQRRPPKTPAAQKGPAADAAAEPEPARRSLFGPVFGGLLVAGGLLGLLQVLGVDVPWAIALDVAAVLVGLAVVIGAILQQRVAGLVLPGIALVLAAIIASTVNFHLGDGVGDRNFAPLTAAELRQNYRLGVGSLELDLTGLELPTGTTTVHARLGLGDLHVIVPPGVTVHTTGHVGLGQTDVLGHQDDGHDVDVEVTSPALGAAEKRLDLDAHVGIGQIDVDRAAVR